MYTNSFMILDREWEDYALGDALCGNDYMSGRDISWVAQVSPILEEFTQPGELIFDPFAGLGTTLLGAGALGRRSAGFEVDKERYILLQNRLDQYMDRMEFSPEIHCKDALLDPFPEGIDVIVSNPPYFHAGKQKRAGNLYGIDDYEIYLQNMDKLVKKCVQDLPAQRKIILFCENIRDSNQAMLPQAYDICKILQKYCTLLDERIILYRKEYGKFNGIGHRTNRAHEYVFIGVTP